MDKYHVALSFAGEERSYVDEVARALRDSGVSVFYDKFEDTKLWGKDLYVYLRDIYQNKAVYTVIFVSEAYKNKLWTNHERQSAQARAFAEAKEYILPAVFDETVEIPGLLSTTGYLNLNGMAPSALAEKILQKLRADGVLLSVVDEFAYSAEAKADVDFPMPPQGKLTPILEALQSYNWYTQNPAVEKIFELDLNKLTPDDVFVLGRNIYQCACGGERKAVSIISDLRRALAKLPQKAAEHLLNGMFYEVYFNSKGEFRGGRLKRARIDELFEIQTVEKYQKSIQFIRYVLEPYRNGLLVMPARVPETVTIKLSFTKKDPPLIKSIKYRDEEILIDTEEEEPIGRMWTFSFRRFSVDRLQRELSEEWSVPIEQLKIDTGNDSTEKAEFRLPEGKAIGKPTRS